MQLQLTLDQAVQRARALLARGPRTILGIVGPPGAGKSTLSQRLCREFPTAAQMVPMDGFHLANVELQRLRRAQRKGAPDTFDSAGYVSLLQRLRQQAAAEIVYAPEFRREIEEPIAGAIPIEAEGNYLLLEEHGWDAVAQHLDEVWYVDVAPALRLERLVARHMQFGRARQEAMDWVTSTDEPNARLIEATRHRAQAIVELD
jgi:pantothenate kinase